MTMGHDTFHELLDRATETAPPALPVAADLAAGRARLSRRRLGVTAVGLAAAAMVAVAAGSVLAGSPRAADEPPTFATEGPNPAPTASAESPVLQDVIDATFWLPGDAQLRNIRVQTFVYGWGLERCGGRAAPLDSTADRFEQDVFPSLELIRERGFTEPTASSARGARPDCQIGDQLAAGAPDWAAWRQLFQPWLDRADAVMQDPRLVGPREAMARCLREATGLEISDQDPVDSVLGAVDGGGDRDADLPTAFADCGAGYFERFEELLRAERPAYVEANRELLERFARQLTALGYVP